jgi:mannosyl-oligosaccharide glucosidase
VLERSNNKPENMMKSFIAIGRANASEWFALEVNLYDSDTSSADALGKEEAVGVSYWAPKEPIDEALKSLQSHLDKAHLSPSQVPSSPFSETNNGQLNNKISSESSALFFQFKSAHKYRLEIILHENISVKNENSAYLHGISERCFTHTNIIEKLAQDFTEKFDKKFDSTFKLKQKAKSDGIEFSSKDIEVARRTVSSILGGIGFFHGIPVVGNSAEYDERKSRLASSSSPSEHSQRQVDNEREPITLLTGTPSRTSFPRGFLWDEGFHQLLISEWDIGLSMHILSDWLNAMYVSSSTRIAGNISSSALIDDSRGGWIPREMILGEESKQRVPNEFVMQRVDIANPPTLLFVVEKLIKRCRVMSVCNANDAQCVDEHDAENNCNQILSFLREIYPALHDWIIWLMYSQMGTSIVTDDGSPITSDNVKSLYSFRWRGRSKNEDKLIPNTLASGLDDYPRGMLPSEHDSHVDLLSWIAMASGLMDDILKSLKELDFLPDSNVMSSIENDLSELHERISRYAIHDNAKKESPNIKLKSINQEKSNQSFDNSYRSLSNHFVRRLDSLHWSKVHESYLDIGVHDNNGVIKTEVVIRCLNPKDKSVVDSHVPIESIQRMRSYCPSSHSQFLYPLGDGSGGYLTRERYYPREKSSVKLDFIHHIGYVSIFPFLLKLISPKSIQLKAILDQIQNPDHLWTDFGLRSMSTKDKFYDKSNAPGDNPYWRFKFSSFKIIL